MIQARLFGKAQLIGVLGVVVTSLMPAAAAGQTATPRGPSDTQAPLTLEAVDSAAAEPAAPTSTRRKVTHVVRRGETLTSIANDHDVTLDAILEANPDISDPTGILAGQVIIIPAS